MQADPEQSPLEPGSKPAYDIRQMSLTGIESLPLMEKLRIMEAIWMVLRKNVR